MDLFEVQLDPSVTQLIEDADEAMDELRAVGDFSPEARERLMRAFLPDRISDTLIIESVYVNPRLTRAVLEGQAITQGDTYGVAAVQNVNEANLLMEHEARLESPVSVAFIRSLNALIEKDMGESREPGALRTINVTVTGTRWTPPDWTTLLDSTNDMCDQLNSSKHHPIVKAAWAHWTLARLHPFENGNGRTARLLQDFYLLLGNFLPVGIPAGRRAEYYEALAWADEEKDLGHLISIIADAEISALSKAASIASYERESRDRVRLIAEKVSKVSAVREDQAYQVWLRRMELATGEIERILSDFNENSSAVRFKTFRYEEKSLDKWLEIKDRGWASNTWHLRVQCYVNKRQVLNLLFYFLRHRDEWIAEDSEDLRNQVALFLAIEEHRASGGFQLGRPLSDAYVSLREIAALPSGFRVFTDQNMPTANLGTRVAIQADSPIWSGEDVPHLGPVIERLLEEILTKIGLLET